MRAGPGCSTPSAVRRVRSCRARPMVRGFVLPRQTNEFYYLCGVETPHAYLYLDGRTKQGDAVPASPQRAPRAKRGPCAVCGGRRSRRKRVTGVDEVLSTEALRGEGLAGLPGGLPPVLYAPFAARRGLHRAAPRDPAGQCRDRPRPLRRPHPARGQLVQLLRARHPRTEIRDLTPALDGLRSVKSPREVALIRRASQLAGHGLLEAMRSTRARAFRVPARSRGALRLPGRGGANGRLPRHRRLGHREHLERALLQERRRACATATSCSWTSLPTTATTRATSRACGR